MEFVLLYIVVGLICAGIGGYIAVGKNRDVGSWAIVCFFLGVFGIIAIAAVPSLFRPQKTESLQEEFPEARVYAGKSWWDGQDVTLGDTSFLVVDFEQKQIVVGLRAELKNPHKKPYKMSFAFSSIVGAEIVREGNQIITNRGNQSFNEVKHIAIRITVDDINNSSHNITFYASKDTKEHKFENPPLDQAVQKVVEFQGYLDSAIRETKRESNISDNQESRKRQSDRIESRQNMPVSAQIAQLWQLKQEGALTEEEFEKQKANVTSINQEHPMSAETLKEGWDKLYNGFSDDPETKEFKEKYAFLLRLRRAISWLGRAQQMERDVKGTDKDLDTQFVFLWISFNALYARDPHKYPSRPPSQQEQIEEYFLNLSKCGKQVTDNIYKVIDSNISREKIRSLSNNKFVSMDFWDKKIGIFKKGKEKDQLLPEPLSREKTLNILFCIFQRLSVLRNQLMHGSATWDGHLNKGQLRDGIKIMHWLLPIFIDIMLENPEDKWKQWGEVYYPRVENEPILRD